MIHRPQGRQIVHGLLVLLVMALPACAGLGKPLEPPTIKLADIRVQEVRALETIFQIHLRVLNVNHGQSPHHPDCSYRAMTDDVLGLLDAQRIDAAILVGHSMGGKVAMQLALDHPQRVRGLAVVDMAPVRYTHDFQDVVDAFRAVDPGRVRNRALVTDTLAILAASSG